MKNDFPVVEGWIGHWLNLQNFNNERYWEIGSMFCSWRAETWIMESLIWTFQGWRACIAPRRDLRQSPNICKKSPVHEKGESLFAMNIVLWDVPKINRLVWTFQGGRACVVLRRDLRRTLNKKDWDQCLHEKEESLFAMNHVLRDMQNIDKLIQTFQR